jgi:hypothetical protein
MTSRSTLREFLSDDIWPPTTLRGINLSEFRAKFNAAYDTLIRWLTNLDVLRVPDYNEQPNFDDKRVLRLKPKFDKLIVALNEDRTAVYEELRKLEIKYAPVLKLTLTRESLEAKKIPELVRLSTLLDFSTFQKDVARLNLILSRFKSLVSSINTTDMVYYNRPSQGMISFSLSGATSILTGIDKFREDKRRDLIGRILGEQGSVSVP